MDKRNVGNRRTEEELESLRIEQNKLTFVLEEQEDFNGTPEQLELMQNMERAYIDGAPLVSDEEWDLLKNKHNYSESLTSVAPSGREWIKLMSPLPSIDKGGSLEDLTKFLEKFDKGTVFKIETKLDGLSANIRYKLNNKEIYKLDCVSSKGNGRFGLKLNPYALSGVKKNWPDTIDCKYIEKILKEELNTKDFKLPEYIELRGEAVIPKNEHTYEKYGENSVWRNVASGMFNRKVPNNLEGVLDYLYGKTLNQLIKDDFIPKELSEARLIASLGNDEHRFLRNSTLVIAEDGYVCIKHADGAEYAFYDDGEEMDIVFYSMSIDGSNIDTSKMRSIPGIKYLSDVEWEESKSEELKCIPKVYRETSDINEIWQTVCNFYGCSPDGTRDKELPRLRNMYEYALDGIVIKPVGSNKYTQGLEIRNSKSNNNKMVIPKYPIDQIAVKLLSEIVKVKLERIERTTTTLGNITCSGILDKPYATESGAMVERINLHNPEWLEANPWIQEGKEYDMILSMDIIPVLLDPSLYN